MSHNSSQLLELCCCFGFFYDFTLLQDLVIWTASTLQRRTTELRFPADAVQGE